MSTICDFCFWFIFGFGFGFCFCGWGCFCFAFPFPFTERYKMQGKYVYGFYYCRHNDQRHSFFSVQCKRMMVIRRWHSYKINWILAISTYFLCIQSCMYVNVIAVKTIFFRLSNHKKSWKHQLQPIQINAVWMLKPK